MKFSAYKKMVQSVKYKDFSIELSDIAKYPGEIILEYKYTISCPNWEKSGMPGARIIFPSNPPMGISKKMFTGFDFDNRVQHSKNTLYKWLKETADRVRYKKNERQH